jgi:hypothetical protein
MILLSGMAVVASLATMAYMSRSVKACDICEKIYDFATRTKDSASLVTELCTRGGRCECEKPVQDGIGCKANTAHNQ